jgi:hypothetical protein
MQRKVPTFWAILVIIIFAIATAAGISWFLDSHKIQVSNQTAGWKTYTNTKYGFSLEYPSDWQIDTSKYADTDLALAKSQDPNGLDGGDFSFYLSVDGEYHTGTVTEFFAQEKNTMKQESNYKEISIGGYPGIFYNYEQTVQNPGSSHYEFVKDNHYFNISFAYNGKSDGVGEKILSTLQFTK